jgi:hypothetical protein
MYLTIAEYEDSYLQYLQASIPIEDAGFLTMNRFGPFKTVSCHDMEVLAVVLKALIPYATDSFPPSPTANKESTSSETATAGQTSGVQRTARLASEELINTMNTSRLGVPAENSAAAGRASSSQQPLRPKANEPLSEEVPHMASSGSSLSPDASPFLPSGRSPRGGHGLMRQTPNTPDTSIPASQTSCQMSSNFELGTPRTARTSSESPRRRNQQGSPEAPGGYPSRPSTRATGHPAGHQLQPDREPGGQSGSAKAVSRFPPQHLHQSPEHWPELSRSHPIGETMSPATVQQARPESALTRQIRDIPGKHQGSQPRGSQLR